ncbi:MAG TPA: sulfotransferase [Thermoplasmatales archaeon]|nr:sulfotransferase [Thermoplasmatales archaeon]
MAIGMQDMEVKENIFDVVYEPLAGSSLTNLLRLLAQNKFKVSARYMPRFLYAVMLSGVISPFRIVERIKFDGKIRKTAIDHPPVFILGHWRSGTTYLHNLLSLDKNFGYCTTFHSVIPGAFMTGEKTLKSIVSSSIPETRPMDNVPMGADLPQEEEYATGAFTPYAYYNGWCFPRNMGLYNKYICMDDVPQAAVREWKDTYGYLLKKLTFFWGGKRLVLKNPSNTGRIKLLLDMFPDARFIHIYRNPYTLFPSMVKFMVKVLPRYCVQKPIKREEMEKVILDVYSMLYKKYLEEKNLIPDGNLVEVRYEDLIAHPLDELERIYGVLNLTGFGENKSTFRENIAAQSGIKTSKYKLDEKTKEMIYENWKFAFDAFGYEP